MADGAAVAERDGAGAKRARFAPYGLLSPGVILLILFFLVPLATLLRMSLSSKESRFDFAPSFTWEWSNYSDAVSEFRDQFIRSFAYAGAATVLCILIGYPLAYVIAFRGGRYKNVLLFLVIAPFFTSFLIRVISWRIILGDNGPVLGVMRDVLSVVPPNFAILNTPLAVVSGLTSAVDAPSVVDASRTALLIAGALAAVAAPIAWFGLRSDTRTRHSWRRTHCPVDGPPLQCDTDTVGAGTAAGVANEV